MSESQTKDTCSTESICSPLTHRFKLAIVVSCSEQDTGAPWWQPPVEALSQQGVVEVVAVWAEAEQVASHFQQAYFRSAAVYYGYSSSQEVEKASNSTEKNTLEHLASTPNEDTAGFLITGPSLHQKRIIDALHENPEFHKHLFTSVPPSWDPMELGQLVHRYISRNQDQPDGTKIWNMNDPIRFEPAVAALLEILPDIGPLVGGSIRGGCVPGIASTKNMLSENADQDVLYGSCVIVCSLLQKIFGDVHTVSGIMSNDRLDAQHQKPSTEKYKANYAGWIQFSQGATCVIYIQPDTEVPILDLRVWGKLGHVSLLWNSSRNYYEVKRYLQHFEHPSLHPSMGSSWCISAWVEACLRQDHSTHEECSKDQRVYVSMVFDTVVDVTVAYALLTSCGSIVAVKPVSIDDYRLKLSNTACPPQTMNETPVNTAA